MAEEISKRFDSADVEARITRRWLDSGALQVVPDERDDRYVIMMPLPNVTGALHMGHALDNVMQDLLIRWHRMRGDNTLWQPGTDHAGIATQAVVEKRLYELEGQTRHDIGREALIQRIFDWKDQYQARIVQQQQDMGCSCAWRRQRFTMDAVCSAAVRECFFRLFQDHLIFRGERLVNWDCHLQTAVADDEVIAEDVQGHFWHLRYPVIDPRPGEPEHVVVATTRPETMLGDTAVACHPDPAGALTALVERRREELAQARDRDREELAAEVARLEVRQQEVLPRLELLRAMAEDGRKVMLPLQERPIPLILDEWAKPELGSGCVKITPGHDPNDHDVWRRHQDEIGIVNILNQDGSLNESAGAYQGLDRFEARDRVVADLDAAGLLGEIEDRLVPIGHSDRSKAPIEPYLMKQWFVRMGDVEGGVVMGRDTANEHSSPGLAQAAMDAVQGEWRSPTGLELTFHPDHDRYAGTYLAWLGEKRDWNISRQLWWGHRIPIWMTSLDGATLGRLLDAVNGDLGEKLSLWVETPEGEKRDAAGARELAGGGPYEVQLCIRSEKDEEGYASLIEKFGLTQDPDVLDTWFSSALWPFSTLGWPDPEGARVEEGQTPLGATGERESSLDYYYPGSCLVTARDIITLWVARMHVMGLYILGDLPFFHCFVHANILDGKGVRMSKSKGNGIDPVDIIQRYGADSLRYVLCDLQTGTQDIRIPVQAISPFTGNPVDLTTAEHGRSVFTYICPETGEEFDVLGTLAELPKSAITSDRFEVGKAFCTKLWNAARFAFMRLGDHAFAPVAWERLAEEDRWILSRLSRTTAAVDRTLTVYNPSAALASVRDFFWNDLCDWYIEMIKPRLEDKAEAPVCRSVLALVLDHLLRLLHPVVPFITEELWAKLGAQCPVRGLEEPLPASEMLLTAPWPEVHFEWQDEAIEEDFELLQRVVRGVRDLRARYQVSPRQELAATLRAAGATGEALTRLTGHLRSQAGLGEVTVAAEPGKPKLAATTVVGEVEVWVAGVLDPEKERSRLEKQQAKLEKQLEGSRKKLGNPKFVEKAKPAVVEAEKQRLADLEVQLQAVQEGLAAL